MYKKIIKILERKSTIPSDDYSWDEIDNAYDKAKHIIASFSRIKDITDDDLSRLCDDEFSERLYEIKTIVDNTNKY